MTSLWFPNTRKVTSCTFSTACRTKEGWVEFLWGRHTELSDQQGKLQHLLRGNPRIPAQPYVWHDSGAALSDTGAGVGRGQVRSSELSLSPNTLKSESKLSAYSLTFFRLFSPRAWEGGVTERLARRPMTTPNWYLKIRKSFSPYTISHLQNWGHSQVI